jgi:hypothetical protein
MSYKNKRYCINGVSIMYGQCMPKNKTFTFSKAQSSQNRNSLNLFVCRKSILPENIATTETYLRNE